MFHIRLKALREKRGLELKQVYTAIKIERKNYYNLEHGNSEPKYRTLIALADYFDVSMDYLAGRTDNPEVNK